jgi:RNA polymerase sigma factor (sigma-70 family)
MKKKKMEKEDFSDFLSRCIRKEKDTWDLFVERYIHLIYNYIYHTLKRYNYAFQNEEVEDICHDIFLHLLDDDCRQLRNFRGRDEYAFMAYLRTISFSSTVDFLRSRRKFVNFDKVQYILPIKDKFNKLHRKDFRTLMGIIKDNLPKRHNRLFELIYEKELNNTEIADIMNLKKNAVHQLRFRMMKNVSKIVKKKNIYDELEIFMMSPVFADHKPQQTLMHDIKPS